MTREIIEQFEFGNMSVNTFSMGHDNGEGVQITLGGSQSWIQLPRDEAVKFFETALERLKTQIEEDKIHPPWWHTILLKE